MPLLRKKEFQKSTIPELLRDDEEVFHCVVTNEIFRDYDEFCQRIILVNSMVWSCAMTGKSNLTYSEALQSEQAAKKSLKDFPMELRIPVLFLASKTKRSAFGEMAEDVFAFVKDRYFVGENVESCFTENDWREAYVLQVIAPSTEEIEEYIKTNNINGKSLDRKFSPPSVLFRYEVEQLDANDQDSSQVMIVEANHVRRKKGPFSKEKLRLFLKQFVELKDTGIICIKESVKRKYKFENVRFDQLFDGPLPEFEHSKKVVKGINGKVKKVRQESIATFLRKGNTSNGKENGKLLMEEMKRKEVEYREKLKEMKQKRVEEKILERQKRKEESLKIATLVKDWNKPRDDLLLEDQKPLPVPSQVETKIPTKYFGDVLMILDFINSFSTVINAKDFFPYGLTFDLMERALTESEVAGPCADIIQMLLAAIFKIQDAEAAEIKQNQADNADDNTMSEEVREATMASKWSMLQHGTCLNKLPLYPVTVSEVLRLHLLSSGARINEAMAKWRYQQRGGYTNEDDPGLELRRRHPHILDALAVHNANQLPLGDKVTVLACLVNQLLTYTDVRDAIDERRDAAKDLKAKLRAMHGAKNKINSDFMTNKNKIKREHKDDDKCMQDEMDKLKSKTERLRTDIEQKATSVMESLWSKDSPHLGMDRSYHKYIKIESLPAFFVLNDEQFPGDCLDKLTTHKPELIDADPKDTMNYVKQLLEETSDSNSNANANSSSDKENENSRKKNAAKKVNGARDSLKNESELLMCARSLRMCTANSHPCPVHTDNKRPSWGFFHQKDDVQALINSLNKRGMREAELRQTLEMGQACLEKVVAETCTTTWNATVEVKKEETLTRRNGKKPPKPLRYEDSHLGFSTDLDVAEVLSLSLVENILEMEEKIHNGGLGQLKVNNRNVWRELLNARKYDQIDKTLVKREEKIKGEGKKSNSRPNTPDSNASTDQDNKGPVKYLKVALERIQHNGFNNHNNHNNDNDNDDNNKVDVKLSKKQLNEVKALAIALVQVAQAVEKKHLMKPLGVSNSMFNRWEQSLMSSTSYSQVFLHYCTLDNCIVWGHSTVGMRCQVCRRKGNAKNMLLCDSCYKGYHLYCLKPKLSEMPQDDWMCDKCKPIEECPTPRTARKARKIFTEEEEEEDDDDDDEDEEEDEEHLNDEEEDWKDDDEDYEDSYTKKKVIKEEEVCEECGSGGRVICCDFCPKVYHLECTQPVLRRVPRNEWKCHRCHRKRTNNKKQEKQQPLTTTLDESESDSSYGSMEEMPLLERMTVSATRRCATQALTKIHGFARTLRRNSVDSDSGKEYTQQRRSTRRAHDSKGGDGDLPLNNVALQELLADVMKHRDAWPFTRPVTKQEVPDYFDVIKNPMDFGTIKYKLNMGEYHHDAQVMVDAALVFQNCDTYNHSEADIYKCGVRLLKYFEKRAHDLGFSFPKNVMGSTEETDQDGPAPPKKSRNQ